MTDNFSKDPEHYDDLVARQIGQYSDMEIMHDLPDIYEYVSEKYTAPQSQAVTGYNGLMDLYAGTFQRSLHQSDSPFIASVGSGDCSIEIDIVKTLLSRNENNFFFICFELSPILIEKARKKIDDAGLGDLITVAQIDINKWQPRYSFAGIMAHHSLHHFLHLEDLFAVIKKSLAANGRFVTCDIIGRNGHMRWPEALTLTRAIWNRLPRKYKYNHQFRQFEDYFNNFDCSTEGFEGIRAEDILPLLVKHFNFEIFFGHGNLIDPFIDRNFGPNFDPADPKDIAFIDYIHQMNQQLISEGILKPTSMTAVMVNEPVSRTKAFQHWDPAFCIRDPEAVPPTYDLNKLIAPMPLQPAPEDSPLIANQVIPYPIGQKISFTTGSGNTPYQGSKYLTYGWGYPETDFTWSNCEDAGLLFPLTKKPRRNAWLHLEFIPYQSKRYPHTKMEIFVNDKRIGTLQYDNDSQAGICRIKLNIPEDLLGTKDNIEVSFLFPNRRLPQFEAGDDLRALGIALISATISDT